MKNLTIKTLTGETREVILVNRISQNMFACKTSSRKRKSDLFVSIDMIITDVSDIKFTEEVGEDSTHKGMSQDEFDGLKQAGELGLKFPEPTMLVNN